MWIWIWYKLGVWVVTSFKFQSPVTETNRQKMALAHWAHHLCFMREVLHVHGWAFWGNQKSARCVVQHCQSEQWCGMTPCTVQRTHAKDDTLCLKNDFTLLTPLSYWGEWVWPKFPFRIHYPLILQHIFVDAMDAMDTMCVSVHSSKASICVVHQCTGSYTFVKVIYQEVLNQVIYYH